MELGLAAADALAHLFDLLRGTPAGKRVVEGALKIAALDSVAIAIRATADGDANVKAALTAWMADAKFEVLVTAEGTAQFVEAVEQYRFIAGNIAGPTTREAAEETLRLFCEEWKKAVLGEQGYAKEQLDVARDELRQQQDQANLTVVLDQLAGLHDQNAALRELIESRSGMAAGAGTNASGKVAARLAEARDVMDRDPKRAREICRDLRKYETLTADDSFRVATNIGVASLRLGDLPTADTELRQALELQPNNSKALYNAASVALRLDKVAEAVELARRAYEIEPHSGLATLNYLDSLRVAGETKVLLELLPAPDAWPADTPLAGATMLYVALDKFEEAEAVARRAEKADPDNPVVLDLLASVYLVPRRGLLNIDPKEHAQEAERLLDRAIVVAETWETKAPLASALFQRARARALQRKHAEALDDCTAAAINGGERDEIHQLRGLIYLELRQFGDAIRELEQVEHSRTRPEIAYPLALAAIELRNLDHAIELLEPFLNEDARAIAFRGAAEMLIAAYSAADRVGDLDALLARLDSLTTTVPILAPVVAEEKLRRGATEDALATLTAAAGVAEDPEERAFIQLQTANLFAQQKRFAEAAAKYEEVLAFAPDLDATRRRIIALYNAGDVSAALRAAQELRGDGPAVPTVSELEAQILWQTRNSVEAEKVFRLLAAAEPQKKVHLFRAIKARADFDRAGATEEARYLTPNGLGDGETMLEAASLRERLQLPDVLEWYYRGVAQSPDDQDVVLGFMGAYTRRRGTVEAKDPTEVTTDCAVTLRRGEDKRIIVIAPAPDPVARAEYFASDSPFALRLLGKREGEAIGLTVDDEERGRLYTIEIITSRYALAFYQLMTAYPLHFPDSKAIRMGEGEEELLANMDRSDAYYRHVLALYEGEVISLNGAADMLRTSVVQLWGSVVADPQRSLRAAVGSPDEARLVEAAMGRPSIVIDMTAALTLEYLGLSDTVFASFEKCYVPRRVIDELEQLLVNEFASDAESLSMSKEGEHYVARERTADQRRDGRETTERVLERLKRAGDILPHTSLIELRQDEVEKLLRRLGETSLATLLVAEQKGAAFLADDVITRRTGYAKWQLPSVDTQGVLLHLRRKGSIDENDYLSAIQKLSNIGYRFLRVTAGDLFTILKREGFSITTGIQRLFRTLEGPDCNDDSSVHIITELIVRLYDEVILPANVALVVDFLCFAHSAGRDAAASMKMLKRIASSALRSRPRALAEVIGTCDRIATLGRLQTVGSGA